MSKQNAAVTAQAATQERKFNTERTHTVGQFLNAHPDAKRVMQAHRKGFTVERSFGTFEGGALGARAAIK